MRSKRFPLKVTRGSAVVTIYRIVNGRYMRFAVRWSEGDAPKRRDFSDPEEAEDEAGRIAGRLNRGEHEVLKLTSADASSYLRAMDELRPHGLLLHEVVAEYVQARKLLDGRTVMDAAKDFADRNRTKVMARGVGEVIDELLAERKREGKSARYLQSLRSHLARFRESCSRGTHTAADGKQTSLSAEIGRVSTLKMEAWLSSIGGTARTRNNLRCSLVTLFHFARKRGYLPRGIATEADEVERNAVAASEANTYSAAELARVLARADERIVPAIAIGAFAGLRSATIARLRWENVKWEQGVIEVPGAIAKNRKRYLAPLLPCLVAWLEPYRQKAGAIVTGVRIEERMREAFAAAELKRLHNGLRDSFISYRVAATQNLPQVAYEAGNSVEMIRSKYLEARTKAEAEQWFAVMPIQPANVISLEKSA